MKRFIALYFLFLGILFLFFTFLSTSFSVWINAMQTDFTLVVLDYFLEENQRIGRDIWIHEGYKIVISSSCNGILPLIFLYASLLAYPSDFWHKITWILLGYMVFFMVNILRILWVIFATQQGNGQEEFYWSHDIVGNIFLMLTGLALFIGFIKSNTKKSKDW